MRDIYHCLTELLVRFILQIKDCNGQKNRRNRGKHQTADTNEQRIFQKLENLRIAEYIFVVLKPHPWSAGNCTSYLHFFKRKFKSPENRYIQHHEIVGHCSKQYQV